MKAPALWLMILLLLPASAIAEGIYKQTTSMTFEATYKKIYQLLEENRFWIINEIDMGQNLSRFKDKWEDYNLNRLEHIKIMIICNGWYANKVSNTDPDMLALCPMHVTVHSRAGTSTVLFAKPSTFAPNSKALPVLQEAEQGVIDAIKKALSQ